jgi:hypothetical protein
MIGGSTAADKVITPSIRFHQLLKGWLLFIREFVFPLSLTIGILFYSATELMF